MFDELKEDWITDLYKSYKGILLPSVEKQLSMTSLFLDLDSLPSKPYHFKELFIRWLISINKQRISRNEPIIVNKAIVLMCPLWRIVKCPLKKIKLTKEGMFNKPIISSSTIGTKSTIGTINK
jgi:hypothetical protein